MSRIGFVCAALCSLAAFGSGYDALAQSSSSASTSSSDQAPDVRSVIPAEMRARYDNAKWTYPSSEEMADKYPLRALNENVSGAVVIACTILADGSMDTCGIMAEAPKDYGFGMATATAFVKYAKVDPASVKGGIKPGDFYVFTYHWLLG